MKETDVVTGPTYVATIFPAVAHIADPDRIGATLCGHAYRYQLNAAQAKHLGVCCGCAREWQEQQAGSESAA